MIFITHTRGTDTASAIQYRVVQAHAACCVHAWCSAREGCLMPADRHLNCVWLLLVYHARPSLSSYIATIILMARSTIGNNVDSKLPRWLADAWRKNDTNSAAHAMFVVTAFSFVSVILPNLKK